jgi:hypothetical protein
MVPRFIASQVVFPCSGKVVVAAAPGWVAENFVSFVDFLESVLRLAIVPSLIRMKQAREASVSLANLIVAGAP